MCFHRCYIVTSLPAGMQFARLFTCKCRPCLHSIQCRTAQGQILVGSIEGYTLSRWYALLLAAGCNRHLERFLLCEQCFVDLNANGGKYRDEASFAPIVLSRYILMETSTNLQYGYINAFSCWKTQPTWFISRSFLLQAKCAAFSTCGIYTAKLQIIILLQKPQTKL